MIAGLALSWWVASAAAAALPPSGHVLVVVGIGGEAFYRERFAGWADAMSRVATERLGVPPQAVIVLREPSAEHPDSGADAGRTAVAGRTSAKAEVLAAIAELALLSRPGDEVLVLLLGHGTARGERVRFNLPGPDLSPEELDRALGPLDDRRVAVVNAASASGPFLEALGGPERPNRIVVTATASGSEGEETLFGGHLVDAFAARAADADKDERVSLAEAFAYAELGVARAYETDRRMRTEHARMVEGSEGLARTFYLGAGAGAASGERLDLDLAVRRLVERVEGLRREKTRLDLDEYESRLEALLVEIAMNRRAWRGAGER